MTYQIKDNSVIRTTATETKVFEIVAVEPEGIKILDEADNGVEIVAVIPWNKIKR